MGRVFFAVNDALVAGAVNGGLLSNDLYEWSAAGGSGLVSVLPNGTGVAGASFGSAKPNQAEAPPDETRAVSSDGSRVFWTESASKPSGLYVREDGESTVQVNRRMARARAAAGCSGRRARMGRGRSSPMNHG